MFDARTVIVYQAFSVEIAGPALAAGRFVAPFKFDRMTWIKPSFRWMMYRCGWATKPGQERVLAVTITCDGFEWALAHSCLSHYDADVYASRTDWEERKKNSPVRVQWDPERSLRLEPLDHRAIQIGLAGEAVERYVKEWTVSIADATPLAHEIHQLVESDNLTLATGKVARERAYPLSKSLKAIIGAS